MKNTTDAARLGSLRDMATIIKLTSQRRLFLLIHILNIIQTLIPIYTNIFFGELVVALSGSGDPILSIRRAITKLASFVFPNIIINVIMGVLKSKCSSSSIEEIRCLLFKKLITQRISFFDEESIGSLMGNISSDVVQAFESIFKWVFELIAGAVQMIGAVILALTISWKVTLISISVLPFVFITAVLGECVASSEWRKKNVDDYINGAEEAISQFRTVKCFDNELFEISKFSDSLESAQSIFRRLSIIRGIQSGLLVLLGTASIPLLTFLGVHFIIRNNQLNVGEMVSLMGLLSMMASGVPKLLSMADEIRKGFVACAKICSVLNLDQTDNIDGVEINEKTKGKIEFRNVSFKYPSRDSFVLQNVSFVIEPGQFVAFVGESGCGKTTILALLQRFYQPTSGTILIDGIDLNSISNKSLRSFVGSVLQTPSVFTMSVEDNIKYANPFADSQCLEEATNAACANAFINELSDGYNTIVSPFSLSGGQKQRLCIARAYLADTPVLLLDEATAALDSESERLVYSTLRRMSKSKTVVISAHRLTTIVDADITYVLHDSSIVEQGQHADLMELNGEYRRLFEYQSYKF